MPTTYILREKKQQKKKSDNKLAISYMGLCMASETFRK